MEVSEWSGMFEESLHVTEIREKSLVANNPTVLAPHVLEHNLYGGLELVDGFAYSRADLLIFVVQHSSSLLGIWTGKFRLEDVTTELQT